MLKVILCILYISYWCSEHTCIPPLQRLRPFAAVSRPSAHDDVIKWRHFPHNWPFVRGIHRFPVNSPHKGQWRGALMFSLICVWIHDWVNNRDAGDLRRYRAHYDVIVMRISIDCQNIITFELYTPYNPLMFNSLFSETVSWPNHKIGLWSTYSISQEICTRFLLCCALLWLYIDWFSHIHQAYFTGIVAI